VRLHALQLALELLHTVANHAAVGLELRLARSARADATAETLEMLPLPHESRQQIRELRELDLQLALRAARALGKDVEDQRRAVDHLDADRLPEIALLDGRERIVRDEEVRAARARKLRHLLHFPATEIE
jgi:hypothetical protein